MAVKRTRTGYQLWWYDSDGRFRKRTFRGIGRDEAVRIEREILATRDRGERPPDERHAPSFAAFAAAWIDECRSGWKASTLAQYQQILKSQLLPVVGELRVSAITESRIRQLITGLRDTGLSARRTNLTLLVLKMILRTALRRRYLRDDPTDTIRSLREPRTEVDPLDPEEVTALLAVCPAWWRPYFTVACWTGARPNELAALRWGDIDSGRGIVRIRAGRYRGKEGPPKTASSVRDLDLLPPVVEALKAQKAQQASERLKAGRGAPEHGQDYVFTGPEGGLLNVNALRDRGLASDARQGGPAPPHHVPDAAHLRLERPRRRRSALLGGRDARAHEPRDALQRVRPVHPEPHPPRRQCAAESDDRADKRGDG